MPRIRARRGALKRGRLVPPTSPQPPTAHGAGSFLARHGQRAASIGPVGPTRRSRIVAAASSRGSRIVHQKEHSKKPPEPPQNRFPRSFGCDTTPKSNTADPTNVAFYPEGDLKSPLSQNNVAKQMSFYC